MLIPMASVADQEVLPFADVHIHYKANQAEVTTPEAAAAVLEANNIVLAVVMGTPPEYALRLKAASDTRVIPIYSPYMSPGDWYRWSHDLDLPGRTRAALDSGQYHGIGELHIIAGFAPDWRTPVLKALIDLAAEYDVPMLVHTEASRPKYLIDMCTHNPTTRFLWAHAGAILKPKLVAQVLKACPNVWAELSARDPWRYINNPIADRNGELLHEWRELVLQYPTRFMTGTDAVWPVEQLNPWDEADTGWLHFEQFVTFHRKWISALPEEVAQGVRLENALRFFKRPNEASMNNI